MFLGEYTHSIDDKGRLALPARWREMTSEGVVLTRGLDGCVFVLTRDRFQAMADQLSQLSLNNLDVRKFFRFWFAKAMDDKPDKQGRIKIPQNLREYAGLDGDALIIGANDRIEVWNPVKYAEENKDLEENAQQVSERIGDLLARTPGR